MSQRVVIIGSGLAGAAAVVAARKSGAEVVLIPGRPGATSLSSGAWDLAAPFLSQPDGRWDEMETTAEILKKIFHHDGEHPYRLFGEFDEGSQRLLEEVRLFQKELPLEMVGDGGRTQLLLTPLGTLKTTNYCQKTMAAGDLLSLREAHLMIAGFQGSPFSPSLVQKGLQASLRFQKVPYIKEVSAGRVELPGVEGRNLGSFEIARFMEENHRLVAASLAKLCKGKGFTHLALPPFIGLKRSAELLREMEQEIGLPCFELAAVPVSVPGFRLGLALNEMVASLGATIQSGRVTGFLEEKQKIRFLKVQPEQGPEIKVDGDRFVLATGKFIGGGIEREEEFRETIFDLPLFCKGEPVRKTFIGRLTNEKFLDPQPVFSVGLRCDSDFRPQGGVDNLYAAGSLLGGYDTTTGGTSAGVAIATGMAAGRRAYQ
ncbi:MAG: anaerobic glycerol-3-phosphate dehydrogenase subunit B [Deltaproteobacteria bacterium]|nr:anaerobic glycerol-3-phosphate dehydrogenase subunit B [Deltaproteobacteria bacterium]